jgi:uncharacterized flavoprotein (TIGR03862 family)
MISNSNVSVAVAIIGGGPAGLMVADVLSEAGVKVDLYDAMPSVGRKFLMAGKGGMNITHSEPFDQFLSRYNSRRNYIGPMLAAFGPEALRKWLHELGIDTFIGTSGRVFPTDMKAAPLLRKWMQRLRLAGVNFHMRHQWSGWADDRHDVLCFSTPAGACKIKADAIVLALGGGSWTRLGATGAWVPVLTGRGIAVEPLRPSNCGFTVDWSEHFRNRYAGHPLKAVRLTFMDAEGASFHQSGECVVTDYGIEGGLIYAVSAPVREQIAATGGAVIYLDLMPDKALPFLIERVSCPRGKLSMANHLRKRLGIDGVKAGLLREIVSAQDFTDPVRLCSAIKAVPVKLRAARPLDEAISSAGGVAFEALDDQLMLRSMPGVFCAGEMLDWEAPTGGYLLTACFASGHMAGIGVLNWLKSRGRISGLTRPA